MNAKNLTDDKSTLVQVMAWCHQATSHYLSQYWPSSMSPYGVTRPQWVKDKTPCVVPEMAAGAKYPMRTVSAWLLQTCVHVPSAVLWFYAQNLMEILLWSLKLQKKTYFSKFASESFENLCETGCISFNEFHFSCDNYHWNVVSSLHHATFSLITINRWLSAKLL